MEPGTPYNINDLLNMLNQKYKVTITENELRQLLTDDKFLVLVNGTDEDLVCRVTLKSGKLAKLPPNQPH